MEDGGSADDSSKEPNQQSDVRVEENKTEQTTDEKGSDKQQSNTREVEEYSESVKRIAKLTKKMREAEEKRRGFTLC